MKVAEIELEGDFWRVWAICSDRGDCELELFLDGLSGRLTKSGHDFLALLDRISRHSEGPRSLSIERSRIVDKNHSIYELKAGPLRVLWFFDRGCIVICSHAFVKKTQKAPPAELERARRNKIKFFADKKRNEIKIVKMIKTGDGDE